MIAALFVRDDSIYKARGLDCYDRRRDARTFAGAGPVIAHPPCRTWGCLKAMAFRAPAEEHAYGPWAVAEVRRCGGVLEHPAGSALFKECECGCAGDVGFLLTVDQFNWGHRCRKRTRLYVVGCSPADVPAIPARAGKPTHCITQAHGAHIGDAQFLPRVPDWEREATPAAFADWLIEIAGKCRKG